MLHHAPARHQRPKPPGSRNKQHSRIDSSASTDIFHSPNTSSTGKENKRRSMDLSIHDENVDEEAVDIELGMSKASPALRKSTSMKSIGLGLPSAFTTMSGFNKDESADDGSKRPSPPPAYGPLLSGSRTGQDGNEVGLELGLGLGLGVPINTPPTQDIEHDSPNAYFSQAQAQVQVLDPTQELQIRRRRATDAAEAIGLQLEFSPEIETEGQQAGDEIDNLGEEEIRQQLRIMKRQLDLRDNEINMTASIAQKMLQRHEELVSALPPDIKALIPRLNDFAGLDLANTVGTLSNVANGGSLSGHRSRETTGSSAASEDVRSPTESTLAVLNPRLAFASPDIPNDHYEMNDISGDAADANVKHRRTRSAYIPPNGRDTYAEIQQQEAEERLAAMEQALSEARESEEVQRKAAARLRRDFEKLQRDYERAEAQAIKQNLRESISSVGAISVGSVSTPTRRSRRSPRNQDSQSRRRTISNKQEQEVDAGSGAGSGSGNGKIGLGWGMFTFPEFPTEPGPSNWQSPQKSNQSPYTAKPPRPMEGYFRRRRERMAEAGSNQEEGRPMSAIKEGTISGLPPTPVSASSTPIRHPSSRKAFSPPSAHYSRSPIYQMDVTQYDSETSTQAGPSRHLRSLAPSPASALGHIADKMSHMRDFIADSLSGPTRSLGSEIRGAELSQASEGIKMDRIQGSRSLQCMSSVDDVKVTERSSSSSPCKSLRSNPEDEVEDEEEDEDEVDDKDGLAILTEMSRGRSPPPHSNSELRQRRSYRLLTLPRSHGLEMPDLPSPLRLAPRPVRTTSTSSSSRPRPMSFPMSILSHRRRVSSPGRELREQIEMRRKEEELRTIIHSKEEKETAEKEEDEEVEVAEDVEEEEEEEEEEVTLSFPSKIINDAIILLGLLTEWLEVSLVIVYRLFVEARNGRRPNGAKSLWVGRKRYYL